MESLVEPDPFGGDGLPEGLAGRFLQEELDLNARLKGIEFPAPVSYIYNPLEYAWEPHRAYVERYCCSPKEVLILGMNPGPFGMVQTGVPFGELESVRDWLGLGPELASVSRPPREHPRRPVLGLGCARSEVSGARFWGLFRSLCGPPGPASLFRHCFVHNLCPLAFLGPSGRNLTPAELPAGPREELLECCGDSLARAAQLLGVSTVLAVGRLAEQRARRALAGSGAPIRVAVLPHPSPRNARANRGWQEVATTVLRELGIAQLLEIPADP
ncbi:single-strand selective monofunctional uracil DNA glycosylase-like [Hemiscyllium ocellatum]|uniref:single-strand selective monofunctional uracil DNA glycosylase-like n=1 Tax=Hemiscyllium ocellatum TaxID=170820 RepID=UPI0029661D47|nr:single-strand selective monofunctional uracil DNA glycosylase-like [Hemiscyllium ocellatum]